MTIGFLATPMPKIVPNKPKQLENCVIQFDSGNGVTFEDARHHILTMGTTGSGKTASVVLPAIQRLLEGGHCGLIIDIKGNMRRQVYALARDCGRADDIVELGSAPSARPINFLKGLEQSQIYEFLEALTVQAFAGKSHNMDFHAKGISMATDCATLLQYLNKADPAFEQNLKTIAEMFNNYEFAATLFTFFRTNIYDATDEEQVSFVQTVKANPFHILMEGAQRDTLRSSRADQLAYATQAMRNALKSFMDAPGIADNFAACNGMGLNLRELLSRNKILLLRFGPETGPIGAMLSRAVMQEYYKAVFATGMSFPKGRCSFVCLDEYQEVADISPGRLSDVSFVAQAREFNAIFIASTQSMSALMNRGESAAAVEAFASNCNTRIMFYSDDPLTQAMASRYDTSKRLSELEPGQAFVVRYDHEKRKHSHGLETFQIAYEKTQSTMNKTGPEPRKVKNKGVAVARKSLRELVVLTSRLQRSKIKKTSPDAEQTAQPAWLEGFTPDKGHTPVIHEEEKQPMKHTTANSAEAQMLINDYPQFFPGTEVDIGIPIGWIAFTKRAFAAFSKSGLQISISSIGTFEGALRVSGKSSGMNKKCDYTGQHLLNSLLRNTRKVCAFCGEGTQLPEKHTAKYSNTDEEDTLPICAGCLEKFGLLPSGNETLEYPR